MNFPTKRYFSNKMPLKDGETSSVFIDVVDQAEWSKSGSPSNIKWDGDTPSFKTDEELYQERIPQLEEALYRACMDYQIKNIDINLDRVMSEANIIVKTTEATEADYPLCSANAAWLKGLWAEYFTRKAALVAMGDYSTDFADYGLVPNDFLTCDAEVNG